MSLLKFKAITNPADDKITGVGYGVYNRANDTPQDVTSLHEAISGIYNFFLELGLTEIKTTGSYVNGETNYETTPEMWMNDCRTSATVSKLDFEYNLTHMTFAFNDALQEEFPITLRIDLVLKNVSAAQTSYPSYSRLIFCPYLTVKCNNMTIVDKYQLTSNTSSNQQNSSLRYHFINEDIVNSFGFYTGERLYLNIFPSRSLTTGYTDTSKIDSKSAYMSFYLERNKNYIQYVPFSINRSGLGGSASSGSPTAVNSIDTAVQFFDTVSLQKHSTNDLCFIPHFSNLDLKASNTAFPVFNTIAINPATAKFYENQNTMVTYTDLISQNSNSQVLDIKLPNGETGKYLVINNMINKRYILNNKTSILLRCDK